MHSIVEKYESRLDLHPDEAKAVRQLVVYVLQHIPLRVDVQKPRAEGAFGSCQVQSLSPLISGCNDGRGIANQQPTRTQTASTASDQKDDARMQQSTQHNLFKVAPVKEMHGQVYIVEALPSWTNHAITG